MASKQDKPVLFGWREWVELPGLGLRHIKAKIDTGARTSALHATHVEPFVENGVRRVRFTVYPHQRDDDIAVVCEANVVDKRKVRSSGGHETRRWVIETTLRIGDLEWPAEITLAARNDMKFRMLIGRTAMHGVATVDPSRSYVASGGRFPKRG